MADCRYCDQRFETDEAYHSHLRSAHADELGPIDRRRAGFADEDKSGLSAAPIALGGVLLVSVAVVAYVIFFTGGGSAGGGPSAIGSVHTHGTMTMVVDGQQVDFSQSQYQRASHEQAFHFEGGDGSIWHVHAQGVTLKYALDTLGIGVTENSVTFEGTTYNASNPGTNVTVEVNGRSVTPSEYVLQGVSDEGAARNGEGDNVRIVVRSNGS